MEPESSKSVPVTAVSATAELPVEGALPELRGATAWLNSTPLTPAGLRGQVVVVQFCTFSCINWLRTVPIDAGEGAELDDDDLSAEDQPASAVLS